MNSAATSIRPPSPMVSVLMTAYNREQYIAEAIESVLASTFSDFELIIVDDASTDNTVEIARRYLTDPRVQVHSNVKNLGDYPNRNRAASFAKGKYLKYLDSDDVIYSHGLKVMVEIMEQFPQASLGLGRPSSPDGPYPVLVQPQEAYQRHFLGGGFLLTGPSGSIIRSDIFRLLEGFSDKRHVGDTELWLRIAAQHPVVTMMDGLVWWRVHSKQENKLRDAHSDYTYALDFQVAIEALHSPCCPLSKQEQAKALHRSRYWQARCIWRLALRERRFRSAIQLYRAASLSFIELVRGLGKA
jgi:glycosyltransferase involved in cell wall biosynthesis